MGAVYKTADREVDRIVGVQPVVVPYSIFLAFGVALVVSALHTPVAARFAFEADNHLCGVGQRTLRLQVAIQQADGFRR